MALFIEIIDGPLKGKLVEVAAGLTIGRRAGTLTVPDGKISGLHARVESVADGSFELADLNSANGIKVGGQRQPRVALQKDLVFTLGLTSFRVVSVANRGQKSAATAVEPQAAEDQWNIVLARLAASARSRASNEARTVLPFRPVLVLSFVRGPQLGTEWTLGYGPRQIGPNSIDLRTWGGNAAQGGFAIVPTPEGALFRTEFSREIRLNGQSQTSEYLKSGDLIEFNESIIEVTFKDES